MTADKQCMANRHSSKGSQCALQGAGEAERRIISEAMTSPNLVCLARKAFSAPPKANGEPQNSVHKKRWDLWLAVFSSCAQSLL